LAFLSLSADGIRTGFLAAPSPEGVFLYFVTSIKSPSIGRDRVFESASNKALALLHWFTEAASARSIIEPVHLPWNIDDLPPEIRLKQAAIIPLNALYAAVSLPYQNLKTTKS